MTRNQRDNILEELMKEELAVYAEKGLAYAGTGDTLANFKRNAERLGLSKYQIWGVYFNKHIDSINNAIQQRPYAPVDKGEGLRGRIVDARNYLGILLCLLTEDEEGNNTYTTIDEFSNTSGLGVPSVTRVVKEL